MHKASTTGLDRGINPRPRFNDKSANEDLTNAPNKCNMKAKTAHTIKTPLFAKILHKTDSIHTQTKEDDDAITCSGNDKHVDGFANDPRDGT